MDDYFLKPHVLEHTRRERARLLDELRRAAAEADERQFPLLKNTIDALEICEHQLAQVLPPAPLPADPDMDRRVADVRAQIEGRRPGKDRKR